MWSFEHIPGFITRECWFDHAPCQFRSTLVSHPANRTVPTGPSRPVGRDRGVSRSAGHGQEGGVLTLVEQGTPGNGTPHGGAFDLGRVGTDLHQRRCRPIAVVGIHPGVDVPEGRPGFTDAVPAAQSRRLGGSDRRRLGLIGGQPGEGGDGPLGDQPTLGGGQGGRGGTLAVGAGGAGGSRPGHRVGEAVEESEVGLWPAELVGEVPLHQDRRRTVTVGPESTGDVSQQPRQRRLARAVLDGVGAELALGQLPRLSAPVEGVHHQPPSHESTFDRTADGLEGGSVRPRLVARHGASSRVRRHLDRYRRADGQRAAACRAGWSYRLAR